VEDEWLRLFGDQLLSYRPRQHHAGRFRIDGSARPLASTANVYGDCYLMERHDEVAAVCSGLAHYS